MIVVFFKVEVAVVDFELAVFAITVLVYDLDLDVFGQVETFELVVLLRFLHQ